MELILRNYRLKRRELSDLMAQGKGIAAGEWTPTAYAVGRLADVQFVDLRDG